MSIKLASANGLVGRNLQSSRPAITPWVRNPSWSALPDVTGLAKFVGLHAVYPDSNFLALNASGSLGYTVNWGDGTAPENIATGVQANHSYDFTSATLANTNAPVTLTDAGDLVTRTAHGYTNGGIVRFYNIVSTTGLTEGATYYVIAATANTFQVSLTAGGSAVALTTDGSATLLQYKQAIVSIVPQTGGTFTALNLNVKHTQTGLNKYNSGFLDIALAGTALTTLVIGSGSAINFFSLEQASLIGSNAITSFSNQFYYCTALSSVPIWNGSAGLLFNNMFDSCTSLKVAVLSNTTLGTNFSAMFSGCVSLQTIPLFNTVAGTNFSNMFISCRQLQVVPLFNTVAGTNFSAMFSGCHSLKTIPLLNTGAGTNFSMMFMSSAALENVPLLNTGAGTDFSSMFYGCSALRNPPLFNTASGLNFANMFDGCSQIETIPKYNLAAATSLSAMFNNCSQLKTVPLFNIAAAAVIFDSMFSSCSSLTSVPLFNTANGTSFSSMFSSCVSLESLPLFDTAKGITFTGMFNACSGLQAVPRFNVALGTTFTSMFSGCSSLAVGVLPGITKTISYSLLKLSRTGLEDIFNGLGTASAQTITVSSNWGAPAVVSLAGTTTAGSTTVTMANTTGIAVGMQVTGTNSPLTTARFVTSLTDAGDIATLAAHGLSNGDEISFSTIAATTGIVINKIYYVVSATANTFQIALTSGGAAIALTTNGNGAIRYRTTVSSIVVNTSVTLSRPASGTGSPTLSYRLLATGTALLKGWTVTG